MTIGIFELGIERDDASLSHRGRDTGDRNYLKIISTSIFYGNFKINVFPDALNMFVYFSFNKKEDDFASLREYNDYLETIETIGEDFFLLCRQYLQAKFLYKTRI